MNEEEKNYGMNSFCIVLYCIVLYCIVLYCIVLYCSVLYCIVFSSSMLFLLFILIQFTLTNDKTNNILSLFIDLLILFFVISLLLEVI